MRKTNLLHCRRCRACPKRNASRCRGRGRAAAAAAGAAGASGAAAGADPAAAGGPLRRADHGRNPVFSDCHAYPVCCTHTNTNTHTRIRVVVCAHAPNVVGIQFRRSENTNIQFRMRWALINFPVLAGRLQNTEPSHNVHDGCANGSSTGLVSRTRGTEVTHLPLNKCARRALLTRNPHGPGTRSRSAKCGLIFKLNSTNTPHRTDTAGGIGDVHNQPMTLCLGAFLCVCCVTVCECVCAFGNGNPHSININ